MNRDGLAGPVRNQLKRYQPPYDSHYGVVPLPPTDEAVDLRNVRRLHGDAMQAIGRADMLAKEFPEHFFLSRVLVRQEAINSSAIEGTNSTLDELLVVEETQDDNPHDDSGLKTAARVVRDYAVALEGALVDIRDRGHDAFGIDLIRDLHRDVMRNDADYQDVPGTFRTREVWIGGGGDIAYSTYNPAPHEDVAACLAEHVRYLQCDGMQQVTQSVVTRMAIGHAHFEAVHPFRDGNGRVGRLLLPLMMSSEGHVALYLSPYIAQRKDAYYDALKAAQQRLEYEPLIALMSEGIVRTVAEAEASRQALKKLEIVWRRRRKFRAGSASERLLELLTDYPIITARRAARMLDISYVAANRGLEQLEENGILTQSEPHTRTRMFVARDVLRIFNRPFGAEPVLPEN